MVITSDMRTMTPGMVFNGVTFAVDDRVLLTGQASAHDNGVYVIQ